MPSPSGSPVVPVLSPVSLVLLSPIVSVPVELDPVPPGSPVLASVPVVVLVVSVSATAPVVPVLPGSGAPVVPLDEPTASVVALDVGDSPVVASVDPEVCVLPAPVSPVLVASGVVSVALPQASALARSSVAGIQGRRVVASGIGLATVPVAANARSLVVTA